MGALKALREAGLLEVIDNPVGELLDPWRSRAFAVCDHQIAHVYVKDQNDLAATRAVLERLACQVLDKAATGLDHERSGELVRLPSGRPHEAHFPLEHEGLEEDWR